MQGIDLFQDKAIELEQFRQYTETPAREVRHQPDCAKVFLEMAVIARDEPEVVDFYAGIIRKYKKTIPSSLDEYRPVLSLKVALSKDLGLISPEKAQQQREDLDDGSLIYHEAQLFFRLFRSVIPAEKIPTDKDAKKRTPRKVFQPDISEVLIRESESGQLYLPQLLGRYRKPPKIPCIANEDISQSPKTIYGQLKIKFPTIFESVSKTVDDQPKILEPDTDPQKSLAHSVDDDEMLDFSSGVFKPIEAPAPESLVADQDEISKTEPLSDENPWEDNEIPELTEDLVDEEDLLTPELEASSAAPDPIPHLASLPQKPKVTKVNASKRRRDRTDQSGGDEDLVRVYLKEIGKHPLLTKEDEIELAQKIEAGKRAELQLAENIEALDALQHRELRRIVREGKLAEKQFINSNLRLVVSIAKKYQASGLPLLDLIQEGNTGLIHGIEKFDWRKGFKFSTYGTWWIRQAIARGIANTGRVIRLPVHVGEMLAKVQRVEAELKRMGIDPSVEMIAESLNVKPEKVTEMLGLVSEPVSLNKSLTDDARSNTIGDLVPDVSSNDDYEKADMSDLPEMIRAAFDQVLGEREKVILIMRYGLLDGKPLDFKTIGKSINLSHERARQIHNKALDKLRGSSSRTALHSFVDFSDAV